MMRPMQEPQQRVLPTAPALGRLPSFARQPHGSGGQLTPLSSCLASPLPHILSSPASRQAFATFMSALALDAAHLPSVMSIGSLYKARAMLPDALAAYSRAHELAPGVNLICVWRGLIPRPGLPISFRRRRRLQPWPRYSPPLTRPFR